MSRGKGKKQPKLIDVGKMDSEDTEGHLSPAPVGVMGGIPVGPAWVRAVGAGGKGGGGAGGTLVANGGRGGSAKQIGTYGEVPIYESTEVPEGKWVNVPKGMTAIEGCYVDGAGVMRFKENNAPAVWHHPSSCKYHQPPCTRRIKDPREIVYGANNSPWCPDCIGKDAQDAEFKKNDPAADVKVVNIPIPVHLRTPEERVMYLQGKKTEYPHLAEAIDNVIGQFVEVEEFGFREKVMSEEDIQKLSATTDTGAPEIFRNQASKQHYYPSGAPRRW